MPAGAIPSRTNSRGCGGFSIAPTHSPPVPLMIFPFLSAIPSSRA